MLHQVCCHLRDLGGRVTVQGAVCHSSPPRRPHWGQTTRPEKGPFFPWKVTGCPGPRGSRTTGTTASVSSHHLCGLAPRGLAHGSPTQAGFRLLS